MKVLYDNGEGYKWWTVSEIRPDSSEFVIKETGEVIPFGLPRQVRNDIRQNYIWCSNCYEKIKITDGNCFEEHCIGRESRADCMKCERFKTTNSKLKGNQVKMLPDGKVEITSKHVGDPACGNVSWRLYTTAEAKASGVCKYYQCRRYGGIIDFRDSVWLKYPKMRETILTITAFNKSKKWKFEEYRGNEILYTYNGVTAKVKTNGEFMYFEASKRSRGTINFFYSPEYDSFFSTERGWKRIGHITTDSLSRYLKAGREDAIINEIKNLYK